MISAFYQYSFNLTPSQVVNVLEALLWIAIGIALSIVAFTKPAFLRRRCLLGAAAFIFFGASDLIEAWSGAWWRPWWLLIWKGICLLVLLILLFDYYRRRRMLRAKSDQNSL